MSRNSRLPSGFRQWGGKDGLSLLARALSGATSARRELQARWSQYHGNNELFRLEPRTYLDLLRAWFRDFHPSDGALQRTVRAIRRNRKRVPTWSDLEPLFRHHVPSWTERDVTEAWALIALGPKGVAQRPRFPSELLPKRRGGRPTKDGLSSETLAKARRILTILIQSQRNARICKLNPDECRLLASCGLILDARPHPATRFLVPNGDALLDDDSPTWFGLPWQQRLFWRVIGLPMPGVRHLLRAPDRSGSKPSRVDRAANEMLRAALDSAGRTWRSRRPSTTHDLAEAHARAEAVMKAEREIARFKREGIEPPGSLYAQAFVELGK